MGKLWRARSVWTPYSASAGTGSSPKRSLSTRVALIASVRSLRPPSVSSQESPMELTDFIQHLPSRAAFAPDKMTNLDCFRSPRLLVGLNCFEAGQSQPIHAHAGADKFYLVVSGKARFVVGDRTLEARSGDLVVAPQAVAHGVEQALARSIVLVAIAPGPGG